MLFKTFVVLVILWQFCVGTSAQPSKKFFRSDYTYFDATESFYKIHTIHRSWYEAKKLCAAEGAKLFYPQDRNEADVVLGFLNETQAPLVWVYVGAAALLAKGVYETIDGVPIRNLYHNWSQGEPSGDGICMALHTKQGTLDHNNCIDKLSCVCKKTLASLQWNELCNMPNTDYEYNDNLGRCYKFHLNPLSWTDAYAACSHEQSYLAVIDSQAEADHLVALTDKAPKEIVTGNYIRGAVHVGFHNKTDDGWITIKGVPLLESGYSSWGNGEPNGAGDELCGSMYYNGKLNDFSCDNKSFFICEHDVERLSFALDERFPNDSQNSVDEKLSGGNN